MTAPNQLDYAVPQSGGGGWRTLAIILLCVLGVIAMGCPLSCLLLYWGRSSDVPATPSAPAATQPSTSG